MFKRNSIRFYQTARRLVHRVGLPQHLARGVAVGFFAAMFPVPLFRVFLSVVIAWGVRGSKLIAILCQFIYALIGTAFLTGVQFWIGSLLWRGPPGKETAAIDAVALVNSDWRWLHPIDSTDHAVRIFSHAGPSAMFPLLIGCLISGVIAAGATYPLGVIAGVQFYIDRMRRRERRGYFIPRPRGRVDIPPPKAGYVELTESAALARYALRQKTFVRARSVTLLINGEQAYPEMLRAIGDAKARVDMETYILIADQTGNRFAKALSAAAQRGVATRLLYDCVGAMGLPQAYVTGLVRAGVCVGAYKPLSSLFKRSLMALQRRDHRKILIVDKDICFTGGLNISDHNAPKSEGGMGWRDTHVRIDGAEVADKLRVLFEETWKQADACLPENAQPLAVPETRDIKATLDSAPPPPAPLKPTSENVLVQVLGNKEFLQRVRLRRAYVHAIRNAKRYILIENAYFVPDRGIRRALYRAVKRGVIVAAGVAMYSDVKVVAMASRSLYSELLSNGVRLFEYPLSMLHSKVAVIDDVWSMVGSYNLDHRSLLHNLEAGVLIVDRPFAVRLRDQILSDIFDCREVTQEFHEARPWDEVITESLAYQMRYWL